MGSTACTEPQCLYKGDLYLYLAEVLWAVTLCSSETDCQSLEEHVVCVFCTEGMWYQDSSVGIATGYELNGPGIESRWEARFSSPVQTGPGAHPASCTMSTGSFPGVKSGRGVTLTPHTLLVPLVMKE